MQGVVERRGGRRWAARDANDLLKLLPGDDSFVGDGPLPNLGPYGR
jgi:hypothetical protein